MRLIFLVIHIALPSAAELSGNKLCDESPATKCTCSGMLFLTDIEDGRIDNEDVKQGFRKAARKYHPDSQSPMSSSERFEFLTWCKDHFLHKGRRKDYLDKLRKLQRRSTKRKDPVTWLSEELQIWHEELRDDIHNGQSQKDDSQTNSQQPVEELHVFLDNSKSMKIHAAEAKRIFKKIEPRVTRTPTNIHLIGSNWIGKEKWGFCHAGCKRKGTGEEVWCESCENLTYPPLVEVLGPRSYRLFDKDADFEIEEVLEQWNMTGLKTYLWQYLLHPLLQESSKEHEVVIITDGHDNDSGGDFHGIAGFNALMQRLKESGRKLPRFIVLFLGADHDNDRSYNGYSSPFNGYRDLALASGGAFFSDVDPQAGTQFARYARLSHADRSSRSLGQMRQYQKLLAKGEAHSLPWYAELPEPRSGGDTSTSWWFGGLR
jgi:hypothetical protein